LHGGQFTHLLKDGKAYYCGKGGMLFRYTKRPSEFLRPLSYR
jgi:hypothetical protein